MQSLKHNGIYVPEYVPRNFHIKINGATFNLTKKSEQMAVAWIRKKTSAASPPDKVFMKNFMREFLDQLKKENPTSTSLEGFTQRILRQNRKLQRNRHWKP